MTNPLSDERLAQIRERTEKATPGPWEVERQWTEDVRVLLAEVERLRRDNDALQRTCDDLMETLRAAAREGKLSSEVVLRHEKGGRHG